MIAKKFFVCPSCGNAERFTIYTSSFQNVKQSQEKGEREHESSVLPNLRKNANFVECQACFGKLDYDVASDIGRQFIQVRNSEQTRENKQTDLMVTSFC